MRGRKGEKVLKLFCVCAEMRKEKLSNAGVAKIVAGEHASAPHACCVCIRLWGCYAVSVTAATPR